MFTNFFARTSAWLLTAGLLCGGAAVASADPETGQQGQMMSPQMHQQQMMKNQQRATRTVTGRVLATKTVQLRGTNQRNLVALVRTPEGMRRLVDLGPRSDARQLQLAAGDQLAVRGPVATVNGRQIVIAEQARSDAASLDIDRSMQRQQFDRTVRRAHAGMCPPSSDEG